MDRRVIRFLCKYGIFALLVFAIGTSGAPAYASEGDWTGNVNILLGTKVLDGDDWDSKGLEVQAELGIKGDIKKKDWPVSIAIDLLGSADEEDGWISVPGFGTFYAELEGRTSELGFGVRKIWDGAPAIRPFVGGGIAVISSEIEARTVGVTFSDDDNALGIWIEGGVYWRVSEQFNLGLNARWSKAEVELFGVDYEAGGNHFGVLIGYHWE